MGAVSEVAIEPEAPESSRSPQLMNGADEDTPEASRDIAPDAVPGRKIAIFGTTPSRMEGPVGDDSGWERWTIGPGGKDAHNWERLYEVHGLWPVDFSAYLNELSKVEPPRQIVTIPQPDNPSQSWQGAIERWLKTHNLDPGVIEGDWKAVRRFPREQVLARFLRRMWFSSSISWCLAEAIMLGASEIGLWGIDLESGEEYISQFAGCAHLIDVAQLAGIKVTLPRDCGLLRDPTPYPDRYETHLALTLEKKAKWIAGAIASLDPHLNQHRAEMHRQEGRLILLREIPGAPAEKIREAEQGVVNAQQQMLNVAANLNQLHGEAGAIAYLRRMYVYGMIDPNMPA